VGALRIEIATDNAAFEGDAGPELARILRDIAGRLERDGVDGRADGFKVRDVNGNTVGKVEVGE
jgi:hypothetical protein